MDTGKGAGAHTDTGKGVRTQGVRTQKATRLALTGMRNELVPSARKEDNAKYNPLRSPDECSACSKKCKQHYLLLPLVMQLSTCSAQTRYTAA